LELSAASREEIDLKAWANVLPDMLNGDDTYDGFARV
jgi:hypothetical protein